MCERDTLLVSENKVTNYEDEELDKLVNIVLIDMTDEQINHLSEVFFTLKESDIAGWLRSLQLLHIQLPADFRKNALLIVSERRAV